MCGFLEYIRDMEMKSKILDGPQRFQLSRMGGEESAFLASTPDDCVNSKA